MRTKRKTFVASSLRSGPFSIERVYFVIPSEELRRCEYDHIYHGERWHRARKILTDDLGLLNEGIGYPGNQQGSLGDNTVEEDWTSPITPLLAECRANPFHWDGSPPGWARGWEADWVSCSSFLIETPTPTDPLRHLKATYLAQRLSPPVLVEPKLNFKESEMYSYHRVHNWGQPASLLMDSMTSGNVM
jgi:hypothetical protein